MLAMLEDKRVADIINETINEGFSGEILKDDNGINIIIADISENGKPFILIIKDDERINIEKEESDYKISIYSPLGSVIDNYYVTGTERLKDVAGLKNPKSIVELNKDAEGKVFFTVFDYSELEEIMSAINKFAIPFTAIVYINVSHGHSEED